MRLFKFTAGLLAILGILLMGACAAPASPPPSTPPVSTPPVSAPPVSAPPVSTPPQTTTPAGSSFASLAAQGQTAYANNCARCHGANGQGVSAPAIIGTNEHLGKYGNAKALLDFISSTMPLTAPGSLSHQAYVEILCYLLTQNNLVNSASTLDENALPNVPLQ